MKRTTLALEEDILRRLKEKAAREDRTLQAVANELLRQGLSRKTETVDYELKLEGWTTRLQPGVDLTDRDSLYDLMEGR